MNELMVKLRFLIPTLPRAEKAVAQALLEKPELICLMTLAELARETDSSDASIIRFCRKMGYSGFSEMKQAFANALNDSSIMTVEEIHKEDSVLDNLQKVYKSNMQTLTDTILLADKEAYEEAVQVLLKAKSIHFFGTGDSAAVCQLFYFKFGRLGIPGSAQQDPVMQLMEASNLGPGDVAVIISYEGKSRTVLNAAKVADERGATIICITKMSKSPLLRLSDISLFIATSDVTVGKDIVARRVVEQMVIDALYLSVLVRSDKGYEKRLNSASKSFELNKIRGKGFK